MNCPLCSGPAGILGVLGSLTHYSCRNCGAQFSKAKKEKKMPTTSATQTETRSLSTIAREIRADWKNVYFGAVPYLQAMAQLDKMADQYGEDSAQSIVVYFLGNAKSWKGDVAKRVKAELKKMAGLK